tara:strand:+ start:89331 stop:89888 length:558 start_codon:yes stop_codon:yes gene_type:complete
VIDSEVVARPYAKALFELAVERQKVSDWSTLLQLAAAIAQDARVIELLKNPRVDDDAIADLIVDICELQHDETGESFIRLLASNKRLLYLPTIAQLYEVRRANYEQTLDVDVTAAAPLTEEQQQRLATSLEQRFQRKVALATAIDPNLLGGAVVRAGDTVFDGSARGKLLRLVNHLNLKEGTWQQ